MCIGLQLLTNWQVFMISLVALAASVPAESYSQPDSVTIGREVGQAFSQIVLPRLDGKRPMAISDLRGKKVILIEFASW